MQIRHAIYSGQRNGLPQVDRQRLAHLCDIFQSLKGSPYVYETSKEKRHLATALTRVFLDSSTVGKLGQKSLMELQGMRKGSSDAAHALRTTMCMLQAAILPTSSLLLTQLPNAWKLIVLESVSAQFGHGTYMKGSMVFRGKFQVHLLLSSVHHTRRRAACILARNAH